MPGPMTHRNPWYAWTRRASNCSRKLASQCPPVPEALPNKTTSTNGLAPVSVEPKGQRRHVQVTARRTKVDFVHFVGQLVEQFYTGVKKLHLVLDNLNTHFALSFEDVLGPEAAAALLAGVEFHYTPKHASWLNMAELEIGIMEKQCTGRRMSAQLFVAEEVTAWEHRRNVEGRGISWTFTREKADEKLGRHYVT